MPDHNHVPATALPPASLPLNGSEQAIVTQRNGDTLGVFQTPLAGFIEGLSLQLRGGVGGTLSGSQVLFAIPMAAGDSFPANFAGAEFLLGDAPTSNAILTFNRNGSAVGTVSFEAASTVPVFATTDGAAIVFAANDLFSLVGPATADPTLASPSYLLKGTRVS